MKKLVAFLVVAGFAVAMVACGAKKEEAAAAVETVVDEAAVKADSLAKADSIAKADSLAKAAAAEVK
ncbi:MAG: hypothetical protein J0L66_08710 [Cytophagales bacterium]|nr:hypothetical protein [Cytophagales bacterium]